jgi:hypothetical protein
MPISAFRAKSNLKKEILDSNHIGGATEQGRTHWRVETPFGGCSHATGNDPAETTAGKNIETQDYLST